MTSPQLFSAMPLDLAMDILEYAHTNEKQMYRTALAAVAQARKVRPVFLDRQSRPERFLNMIATLSKPPLVLAANSLISTWLLKKQAPMLAAFLDALGIKHESGVVESLPGTVDDEALRAAVEKLLAGFPPQTVALYLHAFNDMNEAKWANLDALLAQDPRLKL